MQFWDYANYYILEWPHVHRWLVLGVVMLSGLVGVTCVQIVERRRTREARYTKDWEVKTDGQP